MQDYTEIANTIANDFGANATYVEDLLRQFEHNPHSVGDEWSAYFTGLLNTNGAVKAESSAVGAPAAVTSGSGSNGAATQTAKPAVQAQAAQAPATGPATETAGERLQIRGPALKIVENMEVLPLPCDSRWRLIQRRFSSSSLI